MNRCELCSASPLTTIVGIDVKARDSATGCANTFSLKYIQTTAFLNLYNNSLQGSSHKWRPSSERSRRPRVLSSALHQRHRRAENLASNGPPRCSHLSFTWRAGYVRGQGKNQPFRKGGKLRSGGKTKGSVGGHVASAYTWRTEPWQPQRGERCPQAKQK